MLVINVERKERERGGRGEKMEGGEQKEREEGQREETRGKIEGERGWEKDRRGDAEGGFGVPISRWDSGRGQRADPCYMYEYSTAHPQSCVTT